MTASIAERIHAANTALIVEGDLDRVGEFFAEDYVVHLTEQNMKGGHDTVKKVVTMFRSAFSELTCDVEILVEGSDRVAWQRTLRGVHSGSFRGFPATGKPIVWRDMLTSVLDGQRITEEWVVSDLAEQLLAGRKK